MGLTDLFQEWRKKNLPPVNTTTIVRHYAPISGAISHTLFSVHIFAPTLVTKVFPVYDLAVSNTVLFNSHVGIGLYVFFRPHLYRLNNWDRVEFSVFASVIFNFGSLLFAVLLKALLPKSVGTTVRALIGASLSAFLLNRGMKYLRHIDFRASISTALAEKPNTDEYLTEMILLLLMTFNLGETNVSYCLDCLRVFVCHHYLELFIVSLFLFRQF
uniref:Uncharacterized protein n=1 Tax=Panagrolaimus sp. JU765 TaxID=591449 RepID=A0AC34QJM8_9BILA